MCSQLVFAEEPVDEWVSLCFCAKYWLCFLIFRIDIVSRKWRSSLHASYLYSSIHPFIHLSIYQPFYRTSMSSPNATGCIALLLSAAKAEGIKVTPARLKRAIMNSAKVMDGLSCLQQGSGMIQVVKAWEYLKQYKDDSFEDVSVCFAMLIVLV